MPDKAWKTNICQNHTHSSGKLYMSVFFSLQKKKRKKACMKCFVKKMGFKNKLGIWKSSVCTAILLDFLFATNSKISYKKLTRV